MLVLGEMPQIEVYHLYQMKCVVPETHSIPVIPSRSLEQHDAKLYAQFDIDVMLEIIRDVSCSEYWKEWEQVRLPTLFLAGEKGGIAASDRTRMRALNAVATFEEIAGAGHDVHLERPAEWKRILSRFLDERVQP